MASNPMQRKVRNAVLISVLITIIIMGTIMGGCIYTILSKQKKEEELVKRVYVLAKDMKAGESLIQDKTNILNLVTVNVKTVPVSSITESNKSKMITADTIAKIDLKAGTVLTEEMLIKSEDVTNNDTRLQEYNMIVLPSKLSKNDYIDIRLTLPSGEDFIVASKKKIINTDKSTMWINVSEDDILIISNAIVEAYQVSGAKLYATTYVEPGIQEKASSTYMPSESVAKLIARDSNIVEEAKKALAAKINSDLYKERTDVLNPALGTNEPEDALKKVDEKVEESIKIQEETRETYLKELKTAASSTNTKNSSTNTTSK